VLSVLAAAALAAASPTGGELRLAFEWLEGGGQVVFAVYADAKGWSRRAGQVAGGPLPIRAGRAEATVALPPGRYAVMAFHDRDADGRLDTLPVGLPVEPYGFSNDSRGTFGPPAWSRAAFTLPANGLRQFIRLR
jgi:uncharacterized protein (DUF2141 family)